MGTRNRTVFGRRTSNVPPLSVTDDLSWLDWEANNIMSAPEESRGEEINAARARIETAWMFGDIDVEQYHAHMVFIDGVVGTVEGSELEVVHFAFAD